MFAVSIFLPVASSGLVTPRTTGAHSAIPSNTPPPSLRLLQGFDEISNMLQDGRRLLLDAQSLATLLESVGID